MVRILLLLIPALTFLIPARWFSFYALLMITVALCELLMFVVLSEQSREAYVFGVAVVGAYIGLNLFLLGVRYWLIRRARARILKLPAPKE